MPPRQGRDMSVFPAALKLHISPLEPDNPHWQGRERRVHTSPSSGEARAALPQCHRARLGAALLVRFAAWESAICFCRGSHSFGLGAHRLPDHNRLDSAKPGTMIPLFQSGCNSFYESLISKEGKNKISETCKDSLQSVSWRVDVDTHRACTQGKVCARVDAAEVRTSMTTQGGGAALKSSQLVFLVDSVYKC